MIVSDISSIKNGTSCAEQTITKIPLLLFKRNNAMDQHGGHVFMIRHHHGFDYGSRGVMVALACLSFLACVVGGMTIDENSLQHRNDENSTFRISCPTEILLVEKPFKLICKDDAPHRNIKWHFPTEFTYNAVLITPKSNEIASTSILLLTIYNRTREQILIRCSSRNSTNPMDLKLTKMKLNIQYKPIVVAVEQRWRYGVGGQASLRCIIDGNPLPNVTWSHKDGVEQDYDELTQKDKNRIKMFTELQNVQLSFRYDLLVSELLIDGIVYSDYGEYTCDPKNSLGRADIPGSFNISTRPQQIGYSCLDDRDCKVENSFCHNKNYVCECRDGFLRNRSQKNGLKRDTCVQGGDLSFEYVEMVLKH